MKQVLDLKVRIPIVGRADLTVLSEQGVRLVKQQEPESRESVYGLGMPRRKRKGSGPPTAKPQSSDQAPGEEVVQVNDQYKGDEPAPDMEQEEQAQHQTGG